MKLCYCPTAAGLELVLFGNAGPLFTGSLAGLIAHGVKPALVIIDSQQSRDPHDARLRPVVEGSAEGYAFEAGIDVVHSSPRNRAQLHARLAQRQPALLVVACTDFILDHRWLHLARLASLNVHPSLLPRYRGPAPLFWQVKNREPEFGVSLHVMTDVIDAGPVVGQSPVAWRRDRSLSELEHSIGHEGGRLVAELVDQLSHGATVRTHDQCDMQASAARRPRPADLGLDTTRAAREAFQIVATLGQAYGPWWATTDRGRLLIDAVLGHNDHSHEPGVVRGGDGLFELGFADGCLRVRGRLTE